MENSQTDQLSGSDTLEPTNLLLEPMAPQSVLNDAVVFGDLSSPEAQAVLISELITGFSPRAPNVAGDKWIQRRFPFGTYLEVLTQHPDQESQEGSAFFSMRPS